MIRKTLNPFSLAIRNVASVLILAGASTSANAAVITYTGLGDRHGSIQEDYSYTAYGRNGVIYQTDFSPTYGISRDSMSGEFSFTINTENYNDTIAGFGNTSDWVNPQAARPQWIESSSNVSGGLYNQVIAGQGLPYSTFHTFSAIFAQQNFSSCCGYFSITDYAEAPISSEQYTYNELGLPASIYKVFKGNSLYLLGDVRFDVGTLDFATSVSGILDSSLSQFWMAELTTYSYEVDDLGFYIQSEIRQVTHKVSTMPIKSISMQQIGLNSEVSEPNTVGLIALGLLLLPVFNRRHKKIPKHILP